MTLFTDRNNTQQNFVDFAVNAGYDATSAAALWNYSNTYQLIDGARHYLLPFPTEAFAASASANAPAPLPPQYQTRVNFDTIGQVIFRSIGHCRLPLRIIWAEGINESGDVLVSNTQTFAGALCAPIDASEEIDITSIWAAGRQVLNSDGPLAPVGWTPEDAALLAAAMNNIRIYPGDEAQLPDSLIVADKGANLTNAFRGIRYIVIPNYPIRDGGIPPMSVLIDRTNPGGTPTDGAVEFEAGSD